MKDMEEVSEKYGILLNVKKERYDEKKYYNFKKSYGFGEKPKIGLGFRREAGFRNAAWPPRVRQPQGAGGNP